MCMFFLGKEHFMPDKQTFDFVSESQSSAFGDI